MFNRVDVFFVNKVDDSKIQNFMINVDTSLIKLESNKVEIVQSIFIEK